MQADTSSDLPPVFLQCSSNVSSLSKYWDQAASRNCPFWPPCVGRRHIPILPFHACAIVHSCYIIHYARDRCGSNLTKSSSACRYYYSVSSHPRYFTPPSVGFVIHHCCASIYSIPKNVMMPSKWIRQFLFVRPHFHRLRALVEMHIRGYLGYLGS